VAEQQPSVQDTPTGFYVFLGVMGIAFLVIVGYMVSMYLGM
jgi:hypothetical protein